MPMEDLTLQGSQKNLHGALLIYWQGQTACCSQVAVQGCDLRCTGCQYWPVNRLQYLTVQMATYDCKDETFLLNCLSQWVVMHFTF